MYFKAKTTQMNELRRKNKEHCSPVKGCRGGGGGSRAIFVTLTNEVGCESPAGRGEVESLLNNKFFVFFVHTHTSVRVRLLYCRADENKTGQRTSGEVCSPQSVGPCLRNQDN